MLVSRINVFKASRIVPSVCSRFVAPFSSAPRLTLLNRFVGVKSQVPFNRATTTPFLQIRKFTANPNSMPLILYGHPVSQPTRAVIWLLRINDIPYDFVETDPASGGTRDEGFIAKFYTATIPALEDPETGLHIAESHAQMSYICDKYGLTQWYPDDLQARTRVNAYLHWHHGRTGSRELTRTLFAPTLFGALLKREIPPQPEGKQLREVKKCLKVLEVWLGESPYLAGSKAPTIADIACYCEIDQILEAKLYDIEKDHPNIAKWIERMKALPQHDEVREGLRRVVSFVNKVRRDMEQNKAKL